MAKNSHLDGQATKAQPILKVEGLTFGFPEGKGWRPVIDSLSFEVNPGETLGIVGESGSGKSLTAFSIMGLLPKTGRLLGGHIQFNSPTLGQVALERLSQREMRKLRGKEIAMIFQEPMSALNPVMRCGFQVTEMLRLHQGIGALAAKEKAKALFAMVELPEKTLRAYPHEISGGQKQRVMIAMAMSCDPVLLLADEPTTALDVTTQSNILELLRRIQRERSLSMVFISHDLGVVSEIADSVLVMRKGKLIEQSGIEDLFANPQAPYSQGLLACRPKLSDSWDRLPTLTALGKEKSEVSSKSTDEKPTDPSAILEVKGLRTWFPINEKGKEVNWVKAVDDVSFSLYPGETLGLVGESGCGKTTLGRSILKLISPTEGALYFRGANVLEMTASELRAMRKHFQIIFQDPFSALNPRKRIGAAIQETMKVHGIGKGIKDRKEQILNLLERVGLEKDHFERYPHEFSGGQRQRICIARTLILEPQLIVCDESVSALDVSVQAQVLNLLKDLQEERGLAYLFISHDLAVVKHMSDRVMVMKAGRILEQNTAEALYAAPEAEYTQQLIDAIPLATIARIRELKALKAT
ncbi:MAG: ABC transporter ATP-binding protein [Bacteroidota bacterium]